MTLECASACPNRTTLISHIGTLSLTAVTGPTGMSRINLWMLKAFHTRESRFLTGCHSCSAHRLWLLPSFSAGRPMGLAWFNPTGQTRRHLSSEAVPADRILFPELEREEISLVPDSTQYESLRSSGFIASCCSPFRTNGSLLPRPIFVLPKVRHHSPIIWSKEQTDCRLYPGTLQTGPRVVSWEGP